MEILIIIVIFAFLLGRATSKNKKDYYSSDYFLEPKKKKGCLARIVTFLFWAMLVFIVVVFFSIMSDGMNTSSTTTAPTPVPANESNTVSYTDAPTATPTAEPTVAPTAEPTVAPTAEPSTLQEWAEYVARSVYGGPELSHTDLLSVECEQVDGENAPMIIINVQYPNSFMRTNDERMSSFLYNVMNVNWKLADLAKEGKIEYGSVFIHGRSMFADNYGNEYEADAAQIRIKASEAAKVNWSFSTVTGDMMPGIAVSFGMQPVIREGLSSSYYNKIKK